MVLLLYSLVLSRGVSAARREIRDELSLVGKDGNCEQSVVNLMLTGRCPTAIDDDAFKEVGIGTEIVPSVGMLTLEPLFYPAKCLINPLHPIWIAHGGMHYTVLWSEDVSVLTDGQITNLEAQATAILDETGAIESSAASSTTAHTAPAADSITAESTVACSACTFENESDCTICALCATPLSGRATGDSDDAPVSAIAEQQENIPPREHPVPPASVAGPERIDTLASVAVDTDREEAMLAEAVALSIAEYRERASTEDGAGAAMETSRGDREASGAAGGQTVGGQKRADRMSPVGASSTYSAIAPDDTASAGTATGAVGLQRDRDVLGEPVDSKRRRTSPDLKRPLDTRSSVLYNHEANTADDDLALSVDDEEDDFKRAIAMSLAPLSVATPHVKALHPGKSATEVPQAPRFSDTRAQPTDDEQLLSTEVQTPPPHDPVNTTMNQSADDDLLAIAIRQSLQDRSDALMAALRWHAARYISGP